MRTGRGLAMRDGLPPRWPWPALRAYVLAHRCPTCGAGVGVECTIRRGAAWGRWCHARRSDAGGRHARRDVIQAPWWEDRVAGTRYDTLGDLWDGVTTDDD